MIRRLSFGQYAQKNSLIHSIDPRLKILYVLMLSILIFFVDETDKILIFSLFVIVTIFLAGLSIKNLIKNLRPFFFIFIFILLMYLLFSRNQLEQGLVAIWRFLMLIILSLILTFTTTIASMIIAIEKLLKPLSIVGIKPRNAALMVSITIRFVPVMFINLERLKEAMLARLANFRKLSRIKLLVLALLERMFKSASNVSDAMQSRLYNEDIADKKMLEFNKHDYLSMIFILIFIFIIY